MGWSQHAYFPPNITIIIILQTMKHCEKHIGILHHVPAYEQIFRDTTGLVQRRFTAEIEGWIACEIGGNYLLFAISLLLFVAKERRGCTWLCANVLLDGNSYFRICCEESMMRMDGFICGSDRKSYHETRADNLLLGICIVSFSSMISEQKL